MRLVGGGVVSAVEREVRKAAIAADQTAVMGTPVDTGRARANWVVTVGKTHDAATEPEDRSGAAALAQGRKAVEAFKAGLDEAGSIYITNNVEYIIPLENGHSKQAPQGMSEFAILAAAAVIRAAEVIKG